MVKVCDKASTCAIPQDHRKPHKVSIWHNLAPGERTQLWFPLSWHRKESVPGELMSHSGGENWIQLAPSEHADSRCDKDLVWLTGGKRSQKYRSHGTRWCTDKQETRGLGEKALESKTPSTGAMSAIRKRIEKEQKQWIHPRHDLDISEIVYTKTSGPVSYLPRISLSPISPKQTITTFLDLSHTYLDFCLSNFHFLRRGLRGVSC